MNLTEIITIAIVFCLSWLVMEVFGTYLVDRYKNRKR